MIDIKAELQNFRKINLDEIEAGGRQLNDEYRDSILLYNKAVDSLSNGSEDIAIIELKKAVAANPHFYEALNLLGICYSYINEKEKAAEIFDRVIKGENNGVKAQKYLGMVNGTDSDNGKAKSSKKSAPVHTKNSGNAGNAGTDGLTGSAGNTMGTGNTGGVLPNSRKAAAAAAKKPILANNRVLFLKYIACFAAGAILVTIISLAVHRPQDKIPDTVSTEDNKAVQQVSDDYKAKYEELDNNYKLLQQSADDANKMVDYYKNAMKLSEVESLDAAKQVENAAELLIQLKTVDFTGTEADKYKKLSETIMPKAAWLAYDAGVKLYNTFKYEDALKRLDKVSYYQAGFSKNDAVLYYLGKSYQKLNDSRNAIAAYQKLVDTYPNSSYVKNAKSRIATLSKQP